jgi:hypothetical protein
MARSHRPIGSVAPPRCGARRGERRMMVAHIAGVPVEEWLAPIAVSASGIVVAVRVLLRRRLLRR